MNASSQPTCKDFQPGQTVEVIAVAFPDLPSHASAIGRIGTVKHVIGTRYLVFVQFPEGDTRHCFPENLRPITDERS